MKESIRGVPSFSSVEEARLVLCKKANFEPAEIYPRDGTIELSKLENRISELIGVDSNEALTFNSGMSAIVESIESSNPTSGTILAHSFQLYTQSKNYIDSLRRRGVQTIGFDAGDSFAIKTIVEKNKPDIIFSETVANFPDMAVLDLDSLFSLKGKDYNPLIILDNTLPSPSSLPISEILNDTKDRKVLIVESGTKFYSLNKELLGIIYGRNKELLNALMTRRRMTGSLPGMSSVRTISEVVPNSKSEFDERNRTINKNTHKLAKAFEKVQGKDFLVFYPNLKNHPNFNYANAKFPQGSSPVLFLETIGNLDQYDLAKKIWSNPLIRNYCELGQSFGFDKTRIWPDTNFPIVRIAGGTEKPEILEEICQEVINIFKG